MPATITKKCQSVIDFITKFQDEGLYKEREFSNTLVRIYSDGNRTIFLWGNPIMKFYRDKNEYEVSNCGRRSRTTSHDLRAYLSLLLNYAFNGWNIYTESGKAIAPEDYELSYGWGVGHGRKRIFNPTALVFHWD